MLNELFGEEPKKESVETHIESQGETESKKKEEPKANIFKELQEEYNSDNEYIEQ